MVKTHLSFRYLWFLHEFFMFSQKLKNCIVLSLFWNTSYQLWRKKSKQLTIACFHLLLASLIYQLRWVGIKKINVINCGIILWQICELIGNDMDLFTGDTVLYKTRGRATSSIRLNPDVIRLKERNSNYMKTVLSLQKLPPPNVPYEKAVANEYLITDESSQTASIPKKILLNK